MNERVSVIKGKIPVILVCPHGHDDTNTAIITETAANILKCHAVINHGFEKSDFVDVTKDLANCNRVDHAKQPVVFEEFLRPIIKTKDKLWQKWYKTPIDRLNPVEHCCTIFYIHGCGDHIHKDAGFEVSMVIGCGIGEKKHSMTCTEWRINCFIECFTKTAFGNGKICVGQGGSSYAGRDSNNMNQYFRKHATDPNVDSLQLEFPFSSRKTKTLAALTGATLGASIGELLKYARFDKKPAVNFI